MFFFIFSNHHQVVVEIFVYRFIVERIVSSEISLLQLSQVTVFTVLF